MQLEAVLYTLDPQSDADGRECPGCIDALFALKEVGIGLNEQTTIGSHEVKIKLASTISWAVPRNQRKEFLEFLIGDKPQAWGLQAPLLRIEQGPYSNESLKIPTGYEETYRTYKLIEGALGIRRYLRDTVAPQLPLTPKRLRDLQELGQAVPYGSFTEVGESDMVVEPYYNDRLVVVVTGGYQNGTDPRFGEPARMFKNARKFEVNFDFATGKVHWTRELPRSESGFYFCDECCVEAFKVVPGSLYRAIKQRLTTPTPL